MGLGASLHGAKNLLVSIRLPIAARPNSLYQSEVLGQDLALEGAGGEVGDIAGQDARERGEERKGGDG